MKPAELVSLHLLYLPFNALNLHFLEVQHKPS